MTATNAIVPANEGTATPAPMMAQEWEMVQAQATILARTNVVPKQFRDKPDDIIAAGLMGRELGFGITTSLRLIDVIEGNPELNAEGKVALIRSRGHSIEQVRLTNEECVVKGTRCDTGDTQEASFTWAEAVDIGLAKKTVWQNYRQDMLWARAVTRLGRRLFGDVLQGFSYSAEEIESFTGPAGQQELDTPAAITPMIRQRPVAQTAPEQPQTVPDDDGVIEGEVVSETTTTDGISDAPVPDGARMASTAQLKFVEKLLTDKCGIHSSDRDQRHQKVSELVRRRIAHLDTDHVTSAEASKVIEALQQ